MTFVGIEYLKSLNYHLNDFSPIKTCTNVRSYEDCIVTFSKVILRKKNYPLQSCQISLHFPSWKLEFSKYNSKRTRYFDGIYIIWIILQVLLYIIVDWERRKSTKSWWQTDRQKRLGIWEIAKTMIVHSYFIFYLCYNLLVCMFFNNFVKMHFIFLFKFRQK